MRRPHFIAAQSRCPSGWLGWLIGSVMVHETAAANDAVLEALALAETDRVLDVGCGSGRTVERAAAAVPRGHVAGVDLSDEMLRLAAKRCRSSIAAGRVELRRGDAGALPYDAGSFDKILSVHTLYFWTDPPAVLRELRRVLAPRGRLVLAFRPKEDARFVADFPASVYRFHSADEVAGMLFDTGFERVTSTADGTGVAMVTAFAGAPYSSPT
jgi:SAM-dependent methyltransferase